MTEHRIPAHIDAKGRLVIPNCTCLWCRVGRRLRFHREQW